MQAAAVITPSSKSGILRGQAPLKATAFAAAKPMAARRSAAVQVRAEAPTTSGVEKSGPNMKALKDIQEIMDILPHR